MCTPRPPPPPPRTSPPRPAAHPTLRTDGEDAPAVRLQRGSREAGAGGVTLCFGAASGAASRGVGRVLAKGWWRGWRGSPVAEWRSWWRSLTPAGNREPALPYRGTDGEAEDRSLDVAVAGDILTRTLWSAQGTAMSLGNAYITTNNNKPS